MTYRSRFVRNIQKDAKIHRYLMTKRRRFVRYIQNDSNISRYPMTKGLVSFGMYRRMLKSSVISWLNGLVSFVARFYKVLCWIVCQTIVNNGQTANADKFLVYCVQFWFFALIFAPPARFQRKLIIIYLCYLACLKSKSKDSSFSRLLLTTLQQKIK